MLNCSVQTGGTVVYQAACWWGHLRPLQTAANAQCSDTVDKRLYNVSKSICVAVSWNRLYSFYWEYLSECQRVSHVQLHHLDVCSTYCAAWYLRKLQWTQYVWFETADYCIWLVSFKLSLSSSLNIIQWVLNLKERLKLKMFKSNCGYCMVWACQLADSNSSVIWKKQDVPLLSNLCYWINTV